MPTLPLLAKDLGKDFPRSPRELLAGYVIAARILLSAEAFKAQVATGATDDELAAWITQNAKPHTRAEIVLWNNQLRGRRICDMAEPLQLFLEDYIPKVIPKNRPVYVWFDVYDIEEQRI